MSGTGEWLGDKKPGSPQHPESETQILSKGKRRTHGQTREMAEREVFPRNVARDVTLAEAQEICCWTEGEL